jgi:hypothetical protein
MLTNVFTIVTFLNMLTLEILCLVEKYIFKETLTVANNVLSE